MSEHKPYVMLRPTKGSAWTISFDSTYNKNILYVNPADLLELYQILPPVLREMGLLDDAPVPTAQEMYDEVIGRAKAMDYPGWIDNRTELAFAQIAAEMGLKRE